MASSSSPPARPDTWEPLSRGLEYDGEERANLLRIIAIGLFYGVQLMTHYGVDAGPIAIPVETRAVDQFHARITVLAVVWVMLSLGLALCLRSRLFPSWLKYLSTLADLLLLTAVLVIADGPRSPLVAAYFVVVALAVLRFRLRLIWFVTAGAMLCYLAVNVYASRFAAREIHVPVYQQLLVLIALALEGLILGQAIRKVRRTARLYALRQASIEEPPS